MSGFALGQYWVSTDRERFAEVMEVSGDNWTATVSITDAKGHRLARAKVDLVQFQGQWRLVPEEL
jgi:hypothetical protein